MYGVALALSGAGLYRVLFQIPSSSGMGTSRSAGAPAARQYSGRITPPADALGGALVGVDQDTRDPAAQKALDTLRAAIGEPRSFRGSGIQAVLAGEGPSLSRNSRFSFSSAANRFSQGCSASRISSAEKRGVMCCWQFQSDASTRITNTRSMIE